MMLTTVILKNLRLFNQSLGITFGRLLIKMGREEKQTWWAVVGRPSGFQSSRGPEFDSCYFQTLFIVSNLDQNERKNNHTNLSYAAIIVLSNSE